jgi:hypothetical protein
LFDNEQLAIKRLTLREQNVRNNLENINMFLRKIKCQKSILLAHSLFEPLRNKSEATVALFDKKISGPLEDFMKGTSSRVRERGVAYFQVCMDSLENILSFVNNLSESIYDIDLKQFVQIKKELEIFLQDNLIDKLKESC